MRCPLCGKDPIVTEHGLRKHLTGGRKYGGHELSGADVDYQVAVATGHRPWPIARAGVPSPPHQSAPQPPSRPLTVLGTQPVDRAQLPPAQPVIPPFSQKPYLESVFLTLIEFKALPKYQFERRVDAFLSVFLPEVLSRRLGGQVQLIAPEFPIKKVDNNQSTNVDFVLYRHTDDPKDDRWLFFELKTDHGSVRQEQLDIYQDARRRGMAELLADLYKIRNATKETAKYDALIDRIDGGKLYRKAPIEIVVLGPNKVSHPAVHSLTFRDMLDLELSNHREEWRMFCDMVIKRALS